MLYEVITVFQFNYQSPASILRPLMAVVDSEVMTSNSPVTMSRSLEPNRRPTAARNDSAGTQRR